MFVKVEGEKPLEQGKNQQQTSGGSTIVEGPPYFG